MAREQGVNAPLVCAETNFTQASLLYASVTLANKLEVLDV